MASSSGSGTDWWLPTSPGAQDQFQIHARLLGGALTTNDILPSAVCATLYMLFAGALGFRFYQYIKIPKNERWSAGETLLVMAIGLFAMSLAFFIRAAAANVDATDLKLNTVLAEQILFVIGYVVLLDCSIVLMRDLYLSALHPVVLVTKKSNKFFALGVHLLCLLSIILSAIGFSQLPSSSSSANSTDTANSLRLIGALFPFLLSFFNCVMWGLFVMFFRRPYLVEGQAKHPTKLIATGIIEANCWLNWPACFYAFVQVAVTSDSSPLITSKAFFYVTFGLFQLLAVMPVAAINFRVYLEFGLYGWFLPGKGTHMGVPQEEGA